MSEDPTIAAKSTAERRRHALDRGTSVGRYLIVEPLGQGGMGVVYRAYDPELDRAIALKLLSSDKGSSLNEERLIREAQALARLQHPNVIAVHDVGTYKRQVFIAMEFVAGKTLRAWLGAAERSWREILDVFRAAGEGLAAAHRAGLVHRDFKPDNVIVGDDGRVRVLDFGLARPGAGVASGDDRVPVPAPPAAGDPFDETRDSQRSPRLLEQELTNVGTVIGTPRFMAPEQHEGLPADERADQFSFCVALYEAVYRGHPFQGATSDETLANVQAGRVHPPPAASAAPRWLRPVIMRGLALRPGERHPSMAALLTALSDDPVVRRRRWLVVGGALALVAALAGTWRSARKPEDLLCRGGERKLASVWDPARRDRIRQAFLRTSLPYAEAAFTSTARLLDDYAGAWARMTVSSCQATRVHGEQSEALLDLRTQCLDRRLDELRAVVEVFEQADGALVRRSSTATDALHPIGDCADTATLRARVPPPTDPAGRAALARLQPKVARVDALEAAGRIAEAKTLADGLLPEIRAIGYPPLESDLLSTVADITRHADLHAALEASFEGVLAAEAGHDDHAAAGHWIFSVFLNGQQGKFEEAHRCARHAQAMLARLGHPPDLEATFLLDYGDMLDDEGKPAEAIDALRKSVALRSHESDVRKAGMALNDLGVVLLNQGLLDEALEVTQRALRLWRRELGASHPNVAMAVHNVGAVYLYQRRFDDASAAMEEALEIDRRVIGPETEDVADDLADLALVRRDQRRFLESKQLAERALEMRQQLGVTGKALWSPLETIGLAELGLGHPAKAIEILRGALQKPWGPGNRQVSELQFDLGRAIWESGRRDEGLALATRARAATAATALPGAVIPAVRDMDEWLAARRVQ